MSPLQRPSAELLVIKVPTITSRETNADVLRMFGRHRDLVSLPVLEDDIPIGLISRNIFMSQMSKRRWFPDRGQREVYRHWGGSGFDASAC